MQFTEKGEAAVAFGPKNTWLPGSAPATAKKPSAVCCGGRLLQLQATPNGPIYSWNVTAPLPKRKARSTRTING
jgi:hypothetical protein